MAILTKGMSGEPVKLVQAKLGVTQDGHFGPQTVGALMKWQAQQGLKDDGIAGPDTFLKMGLPQLVLLKQGTSGDAVKRLQTALGLTADGKYGPATAQKVREFQESKHLDADGIAGPETLAATGAFAEMTPAVVSEATAEAPAAAPASPPAATPAAPAATAAAPASAPAAAPVGASAAAAPVETGKRRSLWRRIFGG